MSSLSAIFICQEYFGNHVISSQIHLVATLLTMRRCTLWLLLRYNHPPVYSKPEMKGKKHKRYGIQYTVNAIYVNPSLYSITTRVHATSIHLLSLPFIS